MHRKVILICVDGMRPDGFLTCGNPLVQTLQEISYHTLSGQTVFPPVTLPAHMSLFHSIVPQRHGITTNLYIPMARPVSGLFEQLKIAGAKSAMYYGWEPLRDVARPESLTFSEFIYAYSEESADTSLTDRAIERIQKSDPDFTFLYLVDTDDKGGHDIGWMTEQYLQRTSIALDNIQKILDNFVTTHTIIITSDHGGHERNHGEDVPEDMTIPMFYIGPDFTPGCFQGGSILDITPTIAKIMDIPCPPEWDGKSVV